ncbi:MAG: TrpB-like pyridoxal-phosphate dependent enzyme, partial [Bacteroidetes bacterium]|nr:TrpB-like pyridoxal-phosphate dependent enzyme [Bacteroidota bacterium]
MEKQRKFILDDKKMPRTWYNILADMKTPPQPPLHPGTKQPLGPDDLAPLFPRALIAQEMAQDRFVEIPDDVRRVYRS